jgi:hypothetical protein
MGMLSDVDIYHERERLRQGLVFLTLIVRADYRRCIMTGWRHNITQTKPQESVF